MSEAAFAAMIAEYTASEAAKRVLLETVSVADLVPALVSLVAAAASEQGASETAAEVTAYSMRLIVLCIVSQPAHLSVLTSAMTSEFLDTALIQCGDAGVRAEVAIGLYNLVSQVGASSSKNGPHELFLQRLLGLLPPFAGSSAPAPMDQYREYFSLLVELISSTISTRGIANEELTTVACSAIECLLTRGTREYDDGVTDEVLAGYLDVARVVVSGDASVLDKVTLSETAAGVIATRLEAAGSLAAGLVDVLHEDALFATLAADDRRSSDAPPPPMCKSPRTRQAAYSLQLQLASLSSSSAASLLEKLAPHHEDDSFAQVSGWRYYPGANARAASGYCGLVNFGCTCYVNAMLQQLFMMAPFRRGVLALRPGAGGSAGGGESPLQYAVRT